MSDSDRNLSERIHEIRRSMPKGTEFDVELRFRLGVIADEVAALENQGYDRRVSDAYELGKREGQQLKITAQAEALDAAEKALRAALADKYIARGSAWKEARLRKQLGFDEALAKITALKDGAS